MHSILPKPQRSCRSVTCKSTSPFGTPERQKSLEVLVTSPQADPRRAHCPQSQGPSGEIQVSLLLGPEQLNGTGFEPSDYDFGYPLVIKSGKRTDFGFSKAWDLKLTCSPDNALSLLLMYQSSRKASTWEGPSGWISQPPNTTTFEVLSFTSLLVLSTLSSSFTVKDNTMEMDTLIYASQPPSSPHFAT
ncbi:hypothetical protein MJG53_011863 [Ovis ammon polii x Ovis aries]|uniref:Uncharacterized protein n=2 Tax=Ovis TaxID=9935 RepID=A0A835ZUR1_SHEEP|nr:hypothetical protein JEQ12_004471 [Ovis aries]KAI4575660.1 hypothetical protein MJG53_011863 [Ovis ammon polii x Ovis aries]